jgi:hypothetical protein
MVVMVKHLLESQGQREIRVMREQPTAYYYTTSISHNGIQSWTGVLVKARNHRYNNACCCCSFAGNAKDQEATDLRYGIADMCGSSGTEINNDELKKTRISRSTNWVLHFVKPFIIL